MRNKISIVILCVIILVPLSIICLGSQNDEKTDVNNDITQSNTVQFEEKRIDENIEYNKVTNDESIPQIVSDDIFVQNYDFNADETQMLMKIAMAEAGGEGKECMALVMLAVLNRVRSDKFPNSIYEVIHQVTNGTYQFTPVYNGSFNKAIPSEECKEAFNLVTSGWDNSQGALYFESCSGESWHSRNLKLLYTSGKMKFYK